MSAKKVRADILLVSRGLFESRTKAKAAIMAGLVRIGADHVVRNASAKIAEDAELNVAEPFKYVSRGALKLEPGLDEFLPTLDGMTALDLGASTGGFTDLMLQRGAAKVFAIDVGTAQLHYRLRQDERVVSIEQFNARELTAKEVPDPIDVLTGDVSFISLKRVLPPAAPLLKEGAWVFVLIKPQFEAGRDEVGKGGVVRDEAVRERVVLDICEFVKTELGWTVVTTIPSPIKGPKGNQEFLGVFRSFKLEI